MKLLQSIFLRALCAIITGVLIIKYREETVQWIVIAIGVLFFLTGIISLAGHYMAMRKPAKVQVYDAEGKPIEARKPVFPVIGLGSLLLGVVLAMLPETFSPWLVYILAGVLVVGAIGQFMHLSTVLKFAHVGLVYWLLPSVVLLVGVVAIIRPAFMGENALFIIGWTMVVYGIVEFVCALKVRNERRKYDAAHPSLPRETPSATTPLPAAEEAVEPQSVDETIETAVVSAPDDVVQKAENA